MSSITDSILKHINQPDLIRMLSEDLPGTQLNSILLEVFQRRATSISPAQLLSHYETNRFVQPADLPVLEMKQHELNLLKLVSDHSFQPLELSPVSVLGSCAAVATADQKKILSALRGTEVLADGTNAMALHCCHLRKQGHDDAIRLAAIPRHLRAQQVAGKGFTSHFKVGCLVTAGRDTGSFAFEKESLLEHCRVLWTVFKDYYHVDALRFRFITRDGYANAPVMALAVKEFIATQNPEFEIELVPEPSKSNRYYKGIQYKADIMVKGRQFEIGDGGFVDWPQLILQDKKERMLTTGFGFDFMHRILNGQV